MTMVYGAFDDEAAPAVPTPRLVIPETVVTARAARPRRPTRTRDARLTPPLYDNRVPPHFSTVTGA